MKHSRTAGVSILVAGLFLGATLATGVAAQELGQVQFKVSCTAEAQAEVQPRHGALSLVRLEGGQAGVHRDHPDWIPKCGMAWWGLAMIAADNPFGWPVGMRLVEGAEAIQKAQAGRCRHRPRARVHRCARATLPRSRLHAASPPRARLRGGDGEAGASATGRCRGEDPVRAHGQRQPRPQRQDLRAAAQSGGSAGAALRFTPAASRRRALLDPQLRLPAHRPEGACRRPSATPRSRPAAPHAQHMPSHIFTRVGAWQDSIAANQRSVQAAVGDSLYTAHGMDYMVYAHLQLAQDASAAQGACRVGAPSAWSRARRGSRRRSGSRRSRLASRSSGAAGPRRAKIELPANVPEADWKRFPQSESMHAFARALGAASSGDAAAARREIERLGQLQRALTERKLGYWAEQTEVQAKVATAWACGPKARMRRRSRRCGRRRTTKIGPRSTW